MSAGLLLNTIDNLKKLTHKLNLSRFKEYLSSIFIIALIQRVIAETNIFLLLTIIVSFNSGRIKMEQSYKYYYNHKTPICLHLKCKDVIA